MSIVFGTDSSPGCALDSGRNLGLFLLANARDGKRCTVEKSRTLQEFSANLGFHEEGLMWKRLAYGPK